MDHRTKQNLMVTAFGVALFAALFHLPQVLEVLGRGAGLILPIFIGAVLALFLSVPVGGAERGLTRLFRRWKKPPSRKFSHILSFLLALLAVALVLTLVCTLLIPELIRSTQSLLARLEKLVPQWLTYLEGQGADAAWLEEFFARLDLEQLMGRASQALDALLTNVVGAVSSLLDLVITAGFSLIIAVYLVLSKERICRHARTLVLAYWKPRWATGLLRFCRMFYQAFTKFLTGQCTEAVILGVLMFLAFALFRLPYASLVGLLTAVCAIIPYVGAFTSLGISLLLTLLVEPSMAMRCASVYFAVQFVENQFIYPRVVGASVGLPPVYTLIAALLGGKLFGILGILFFIPLASVVTELLREDAVARLTARGPDTQGQEQAPSG